MSGILGNLFDLNRDGKLDSLEHALEFSLLVGMLHEDEADRDCDDPDGFGEEND